MSKIYIALHNPSCCESAAATISVHKTKKGAYKAVKASKLEAWYEWLEHHTNSKRQDFKSRMEYSKEGYVYPLHSDRFKFDFDQWWGIAEDELLD